MVFAELVKGLVVEGVEGDVQVNAGLTGRRGIYEARMHLLERVLRR